MCRLVKSCRNDFFFHFCRWKSGFEGKISEINKHVCPNKNVLMVFFQKIIRFAAQSFGRSEWCFKALWKQKYFVKMHIDENGEFHFRKYITPLRKKIAGPRWWEGFWTSVQLIYGKVFLGPAPPASFFRLPGPSLTL